MKPARFYIALHIELKHDFWVHDEPLIARWHHLGLQAGYEVVLFDGNEHERLYKLIEMNDSEAHLELVTDYELRMPSRKVYVLWPLLTPDQNNQLLQKCTALGASHFMPLLRNDGELMGFDTGSAETLLIEAAEKGEWSFIPTVRDPMHLATALEELSGKVHIFLCKEGEEKILKLEDYVGVLIAPENGWPETEEELFKTKNFDTIVIPSVESPENSALTAVGKLLQ